MAEKTTQEDMEKEELSQEDLTPEDKKTILWQVEKEYQLSFEHTQTKRAESLKRLKLYNNQKRDKDKVGDPLLFTVFNTVLATLYEDKLSVRFEGVEEGDDETADNLTATAEYDHRKMEKDELDYDWDFDTGFFGRGLVYLNEFDRKEMCPVAEIMDPMTFIRDPRATSANGNMKGYGSLRFWGREIGLSKSDMKKNKSYFNVNALRKDKNTDDLTKEAREARREAQNLQQTDIKEEALRENYEYKLLEWFTHFNGEKYLVTVGNNRRLIVRYQKLKNQKRWPIIDRTLFPISHDWDGVSIPDLIEDKQRARSVMINLGMESAIADLYPMYLFDRKKIPNQANLDFEANKWIPIKGDPSKAAMPLQKSIFHSQVNLILNILDTAAQKAVAAPEISQGVQPKQQRTLGESEMIVAGKDVRHSLGARIFGWSEKRFWRQWYWLYKEYFKEEIDEKMVRIQGPLAPAWRGFTRDNLITDIDPDVYIESASIIKAERREAFQSFSIYAQVAMQEPRTNRMFVLRRMGKILGEKSATLTLMFPPTIDEMRATDENQKISDNKLPEIRALDDDIVHIEIHNKAADTGAKLAHLEAHKQMMMYKKEHPEQFPQELPPPEFKPVGAGAGSQEQGGGDQRLKSAPVEANKQEETI